MQPSAILTTVEGSAPRAACHAQNATTKGVKAKIMNGLKAWNQVTGISPCQTIRLMVRSVKSSAHSAIVLSCSCRTLSLGGPKESVRQEQDEQRQDAAPLGTRERLPDFACGLGPVQLIR